jgi:nitrite reductase/ring-hydroxylating ferredoxin subunit
MASHRIASTADVPPGVFIRVELNGEALVVCNDRGTLHAFADRCPHRDAPLSGGNFVDGRLICPWHGWEFVCETGCYDYNSEIHLERFAVRAEGGDILIDA